MGIESLLDALGPQIEDVEEETFSLFSQTIPSANLGFVDQHATSIDLEINGRELTIHQSPTVLNSSRGGGTTGAVVWKVTPLFARWISSPSNPISTHGILNSSSSVLELGCGISGVIGITLAPSVGRYTLTDQSYVLKLIRQNIEENAPKATKGTGARKSAQRGKKTADKVVAGDYKIRALHLDWEADEVSNVVGKGESLDAVIACDCIYNDALIAPLVATCVDACMLRAAVRKEEGDRAREPTVCLVGQQLRSDEVFEGWLREFEKSFRVWRVPDEMLIDGLKEDSGFVVHVGILKDEFQER